MDFRSKLSVSVGIDQATKLQKGQIIANQATQHLKYFLKLTFTSKSRYEVVHKLRALFETNVLTRYTL